MSYVGMRKLVAAPIESYVEGRPITYGRGMILGPAVAADINFDVADNPDYGDDVLINNDNGINGYNATLESTHIGKEGRAMTLGWKAVGSPTTHYEVTGNKSPEVGWGFVHWGEEDDEEVIQAYWFHRSQCSMNTIAAATKKKQVEWQHPRVNVQGMGVYIDNSGEVKYFDWMEFDSIPAAEAWLFARANITEVTT